MEKIIIATDDGASTIYLPELDEHYHSTKGALNESQHVYIECGFKHRNLAKTNILEIGFGSGLNAFLTILAALEDKKFVHYTSLELFPLDINIVERLNYPDLIAPQHKDLFYKLHKAEWGEKIRITEFFTLEKIKIDLRSFKPICGYDVIYFDAFAPEKQPELWEKDIFENIYKATNPGGVITTYCAKGVVRRTLAASGFTMERLNGPINGKREILRGRR